MKKTRVLAIAAAVTAATVLIGSAVALADETKAWSPKAFMGHFMKGAAKGDPAERLNKEKESIQQKVKDGKLTQEDADKKIAEIDKRIKEIQDYNNMTLDQKKEKALNDFTTKLNQKVKDGKLTQEEADKRIAEMQKRIDEKKAFDSMTVEQKREKLLNDFTASINQRVKDGKLTQEAADKAISDYKTKLDKWDGTGRIPFGRKGAAGDRGFKGGSHKDSKAQASQQQ